MLPRNARIETEQRGIVYVVPLQIWRVLQSAFFDGVTVGSIRLALFPHVFGSPVAPTPEQVRVSAHLAFLQTRKSLQPNAYKIPSQPLKAPFHTLHIFHSTLHRCSVFCSMLLRAKGAWQRNTLRLCADITPLITRHHTHTHCLNPFASKGKMNKQSL